MTIRLRDRHGTTPGDVLIGLATLSLLAALLYPGIRGYAFRTLVDSTVAEVDAMSSGARGVLSRTGSWPADSTIVRDAFTLQWRRWEEVEKVLAPPSVAALPLGADAPPDSVGPLLVDVVREVGAIVVHSGSDALLAELLAQYGSAVSFARDTTWTLVVERIGSAAAPGG